MRCLMLYRPDDKPGGDRTALRGYSRALAALGVEIEQRPADAPGDMASFDFVHLWAACAPNWGTAAAAAVEAAGKLLIVTPFFWMRTKRQHYYNTEDMPLKYYRGVANILNRAAVLFCVTMGEAAQCWELAPVAPVHIVGMGRGDMALSAAPVEDYVLCVSRIEPHKNQWMLARACRELGLPLKCAGAYDSTDYYAEIIADEGAELLGYVDDVGALLARARCHALVSFFENPGLVHIEAACLGVPAVMGSHGCEPEYFGPGGIYASPANLQGIMMALRAAWHAPRQLWAPHLPTWADMAQRGLDWMASQ